MDFPLEPERADRQQHAVRAVLAEQAEPLAAIGPTAAAREAAARAWVRGIQSRLPGSP